MEESYQASKMQSLAKKTTKLGMGAAIRKWETLKESYQDYTIKVGKFLDCAQCHPILTAQYFRCRKFRMIIPIFSR